MLPLLSEKATHVRKARFPTAVADILRKCEKEGKASDYGGSKPEGKNILKYVLEYEEGYVSRTDNTRAILIDTQAFAHLDSCHAYL